MNNRNNSSGTLCQISARPQHCKLLQSLSVYSDCNVNVVLGKAVGDGADSEVAKNVSELEQVLSQ